MLSRPHMDNKTKLMYNKTSAFEGYILFIFHMCGRLHIRNKTKNVARNVIILLHVYFILYCGQL